ncbi:NADPH-dependent ferric siderophore reductase, contains FAD-binding and SIP domains [Chishuiella changwenlii]|uniref:NADPH-dependent ferric siderophore reductase, contains FAD-binding and SIP domains n=1 Tax=Chishuiella changwenlii TaxID=1434701 RepID=A0A1M6TZ88_9FLAO|nr:siderophore-interacting protein [Chishuiella changwenlii]GGF08473.1 siderophore-interacting protein [Chishuiella changwenlii]SHK62203.1 NADPH-dependent ferric siderophore reductase, contains FAD-binding and SIP domains [Chishuiella changwenlii]
MPAKGSIEATVIKKEFITPHYIRVHLTSDDIQQFANTTIGDNNKILVPPEGLNEIHFPEYDYDNNQWIHPPKEVAPSIRTYTHKGIDLEKNELIIDFVNHGESGPASKWAINAEKGSKLGVMMRTEPTELFPDVDWYLLVGDATAIPVISAILETLPQHANGYCFLEVHGKDDEQILKNNSNVEVIWVHNTTPENGSDLFNTVKNIELPSDNKFGYVAAEFSTIKEIRTYLRKEKLWTNKELYAYSYWKSGVAEDKSQADRQKEKNS